MATTAIDSLRGILNGFRALNSKGIYSMNATETDLLRQILLEVQNLSVGSVDLTSPPTSIGTTTPVAVNSTIFTALPLDNASAFVASGSSLTGSNAQGLVDLSQTWNTSGTPTVIFANITDTASNIASRFIDFQIAGSTRFAVAKAGTVLAMAGSAVIPAYGLGGTTGIFSRASVRIGFTQNGLDTGVEVGNNIIALASTANINWVSSTLPSSSPDLFLRRDAANTLAQRNDANSQSSRLYKSFTDASNYTRSAWQFDANGVVLAFESAGTGDANGSITLSPKGTGSVRATGKIYPATGALAAQTAAGILAGTGAPNNANGDNGDFYLRSDGGALTAIYQKRAGTWIGIV